MFRQKHRSRQENFRGWKEVTTALLLLGAVLITPVSSHAQTSGDDTTPANQVFLPLVTSSEAQVTQAGTPIPDQYIVVFKEDLVTAADVSALAADLVAQGNGELLYTYDAALQGFAVRFPTATGSATAAQLKQDERVAYITQDQIVTGSQESGDGSGFIKSGVDAETTVNAAASEEVKQVEEAERIDTVQYNPVWGLDRNDQRYLPLNGRYIYFATGTNVRAYIIDSGIRTSHAQFGGRASHGYDAVDGSLPADDCHGHGTHVAGTVGGATYGIAKNVRLIAVRVLGCNNSGSISGIIAGVNWVTAQKRSNPRVPMVANMSLGAAANSALDNAVYNSILNGVTYVVAAGNDNANACNYSPARTAGTITVGATASNDYRASFSNYGGCVDIFAPGVGITSAWRTSNTATNVLNGTSMAAPHVTGVVALYLQNNPSATPATVRSTIFSVATSGIVRSAGTGSYNRLVYNPY